MLFNSAPFALFFPVVTLLYFVLPRSWRTGLLLLASAVFYAFFIPKYLLVLVFLILVDYAAGRLLEPARGRRRGALLLASILANLGVLFFFKYWNFAAENLRGLPHLDVVLPIGLSFHTFQSLAYTIEVYRGRVRAERSLPTYALYVLFYPQLVAGPIERPQNLLPQLHRTPPFDAASAFEGLRLMAWGFFKKLVVADRLAVFVNAAYADPGARSGPALLLATIFFSYQIYCDFSGYSDIARGAARVMGIRLMSNFDAPYLATSIADCWRRWHISLSTWFRDYVYLPLGGNRVSIPRWAANVMVTFLLSGLWHGASWGFVAWGALHGVYRVASTLTASARAALVARSPLATRPRLHGALARAWTFVLVSFAWIFFRAGTLGRAADVLRGLGRGWPAPGAGFAAAVGRSVAGLGLVPADLALAAGAVAVVAVADRLLAEASLDDALQRLARVPRWTVYYATLLAILLLGRFDASPFVYFQF